LNGGKDSVRLLLLGEDGSHEGRHKGQTDSGNIDSQLELQEFTDSRTRNDPT
jgi:hypothetical protein